MHWIFLVVDLPTKTLHYPNPNQQVLVTNSVTARKALTIANYLMEEKLNCAMTKVISQTRIMQQDVDSCGVFVCL